MSATLTAAPAAPAPYARALDQLRQLDRSHSRQWDQLADQRANGWRQLLDRSRALRTIGGLQLPAQPASPSGLLAAATENRKSRAARAARADVARRDAIARADQWQLTPEQLVSRALSAVERVSLRLSDDERDDALSYCLYRVAQRHGWQPASADVAPAWLEQLAAGRVLNERQRAARFDQLRDERDERDEWREDDEREARDSASVWAQAGATSPDSDQGNGALRAVEVSADQLADALQAVTRQPISASTRAALAAALNGYGSGTELAAALGISEGAARKRLHDGREWLRDHFTRAQLADALALALSTLDSDRVRLTADQRAALAAVERVKRSSAQLAALAGQGNGSCPTTLDSAPTVPGGVFIPHRPGQPHPYGLTGNGQPEPMPTSAAPIGAPIVGCHCPGCSHRRTMLRR